MYPQQQQQQQQQQQWGAPVDECEDDEVQGIFGHPLQGGLGQRLEQAQGQPGRQQGQQGRQQGRQHGEYDEMVSHFGGLMGYAGGQGFGGTAQQQMQQQQMQQQQQQGSQLNANVAAFLPEQQPLAQPPPGHMWQEALRTKHRTPGPGGGGESGPSPPNPFRYGLGFNYPPGKTGLTPTNFPEDVKPFGGSGYGLGGYMGEDSLQDPQQQGGSAWYEHLPQQQVAQQQQSQFGASAEDQHDTGGGEFEYADSARSSNLNFGASFFEPGQMGGGMGFQFDAHGSQGLFPSQQGTGMPQSGFHGYPMDPSAAQHFYSIVSESISGAMPSPPQQQQQQQQQQQHGGSNGPYYRQQQQQMQMQQHSGQGSPGQSRGPTFSHSNGQVLPPGGLQQQQQQHAQAPADRKSAQTAPSYAYAAAVSGSSAAAPAINYAKAAMQGQQRQAVATEGGGALGNGQSQSPGSSGATKKKKNSIAEPEEDERKERRDTFPPGPLPSGAKKGAGANQNRRPSNSMDSTRSSASSSFDSGLSRDQVAMKKKQELEESPHTRSVFKEFYKMFRAKEKESFQAAFDYANKCLESSEIPDKIHWKIHLEMADLAKRENRFQEARRLYQLVNETQPYAHQGWLEYSKMEEECGRLHQCRVILHQGLEYCNYAEQLLTKAIKHEERMDNLPGARALLARLRNQSVDKAWRTILEGALLEARAGNIVVARKVFKYLMRHVPWYGPIYHEATKFEEKNEEFERAIAIVEKGLKEIPRYGPLWFNAFRLHEKTEMEAAHEAAAADRTRGAAPKADLLRPDTGQSVSLFDMFGVQGDEFQVTPLACKLLRTRGALQRAMNCISKELVWKVHFEAAQVAERGGGKDALARARHAYVQSILRCPVNLRWKVWLAGARAELAHGHMTKARQLLDRALVDVPAKSKAQVLLECSRVEEYNGNEAKARQILSRARAETRHEWKVFLESVMLEVRNGRREDAIRAAEDALAIHSGTGRLWAILVQLKHVHGPDAQRLVFREALKQVPKSGEVWCEGARVHMHPLSPHLDLDTAQRYLQFAIQFTPQYGDSFIEALRWHLLFCNFGGTAQGRGAFLLSDEPIDEEAFRANMLRCDSSDLELKCVNADPNYGALWFHCKRGPFDSARQVLRTAKKLLIAELCKFRYVYREAILDSIRRKHESASQPRARTKARTTPALASGENTWLVERLQSTAPGAEAYANFSTGLLSVNWLRENVSLLVDSERRKFLFGSDQIVP